jgi:hypothetical protein
MLYVRVRKKKKRKKMTIRFYILPIEVNPFGKRRPKYIHYMGDTDPTLISCPFGMRDYGSINQCVMCADISATDHTSLSSHSDVLSVPVNIDGTLNVSARNSTRTFLETYNIPGSWVTTGMTYRSVLRTITGFFIYFILVNTILGRDIELPASWLDLQMQEISQSIQTAMVQAAQQETTVHYDFSGVTPTTTMRQILKVMGDAWASTPIGLVIAIL